MRNIGYETDRRKTIEKKLDCEFIRINPDGKYFDIHIEIGKIYNHIKESNEKSLIDKISKRLSELKFKSNHSINPKCLKYVVKKILPSL